eukprot:111574-Amphidinium_carterae.1
MLEAASIPSSAFSSHTGSSGHKCSSTSKEYAPQGTVQYTTQHLEDDQEVYDAPYGSRPQSIRIDAGSTRSVVSEPPEAGQSRPDSRKTKTACW